MRRRGAVWLAWGVLAVAVTIVALTWLLDVKNQAGPALSEPGSENAWALSSGTLLIFCIPGAVIISRRPANPVGWILVAIGLSYGLSGFLAEYGLYALVTDPGSVPAGTFALWLGNTLYAADFGLVVLLLFLFPTGRVPSRRWRPAVWVTLLASLALMSPGALSPGRLGYDFRLPDNPIGLYEAEETLNTLTDLALVMLLVLAVCGLVSLQVRYRQSQGEERQQLKWFFYGAVILVVALPVGTVFAWGGNFVPIFVGFGSFTACIATAMLRYRLYDIDQLITRTVVYGLLTALVTTVYLAIVVGIGTLIGTRGKPNLFLSILATALIAVAFQPARERSRRLANRLVYGKRATPYEVLSEFSRGMAGASPDVSLLRMARLVVEATGAVQATVWLRLGDVLQPQAFWPPAGLSLQPIALDGRGVEEALAVTQPTSRSFPVGHEEDLLGALTVTVSSREPLTPAGEKLITDLATQTGLGLRFQRMKERALFARVLASFLPPEVAELLEASPSALSLREELEATILFSDIRGFSSLAERLAPREVAEVVGRHLTAMVEVVTSHGGVLDKFAGDAVMAVFGAPQPATDHARRALGCACTMQRRQVALNDEAEQDGLPAFQIGIGVNTGIVVAGTLGGPGRLDYTVLGDAVNIAQRLQSEAVGGEILASAVTVLQSGTDRADPAGLKHLKGRQELVEVYRIRWADTATAQPGSTEASRPRWNLRRPAGHLRRDGASPNECSAQVTRRGR